MNFRELVYIYFSTGSVESHCALGCGVSWLPTHA